MATHAQIARNLLVAMPDGVFARGVQDAVLRDDYALLERMLPGMKFSHRALGRDQWELIGTAGDGSIAVWRVGG